MAGKVNLVELELVRNAKTGKGWVYCISDDQWMRAINPVFARGVLVKGTYAFEEGKYYFVKVDNSSWKNVWEDYYIYKGDKVVATFERNNGNYKFGDERLKQALIAFSLQKPLNGQGPGEGVKVNVLDFAKYLVKEGIVA
jgi:hypothetical protein